MAAKIDYGAMPPLLKHAHVLINAEDPNNVCVKIVNLQSVTTGTLTFFRNSAWVKTAWLTRDHGTWNIDVCAQPLQAPLTDRPHLPQTPPDDLSLHRLEEALGVPLVHYNKPTKRGNGSLSLRLATFAVPNGSTVDVLAVLNDPLLNIASFDGTSSGCLRLAWIDSVARPRPMAPPVTGAAKTLPWPTQRTGPFRDKPRTFTYQTLVRK